MLTKLFLTLFCMLLSLYPFHAQAQILETVHIADVIPLIDNEAWVLVDLDNTMFEAAQALGHADWFYDELQIRIARGMTHEEAIADFYPLWVKTQKVCRVKPIEKGFIPASIACKTRES